MFNDAMALPNINYGNPLRHNDDLCRNRIVILLEVVNNALAQIYHRIVTLCFDSLAIRLLSEDLKQLIPLPARPRLQG